MSAPLTTIPPRRLRGQKGYNMKVKDIIKKYRLASNADVFIEHSDGAIAKLNRQDIKDVSPEFLMNATVNSIDVIDNVLTIHIR